VTQRASNLVGGICGLAAVALLVGSFPFTGATPEPGASEDQVAEYLDRSSGLTWTGIDLELFGIALLIVFAGRIWAILREAELEVFASREDAERFVNEVRGDDPELLTESSFTKQARCCGSGGRRCPGRNRA
jgi:hypothetical protein